MTVSERLDEELLEFFHRGRKQTYKKGEIILRAGDTPQGIYLIESGYIKIFAETRQGVEHTHLLYQPNDIFPIIWAFKDATRHVNYQAIQETVLWVVPRSEFKTFADTNTHVAMTLLEQAIDMFKLYAGRIDNLLYSNSHDRTAYFILALLDRFGELRQNGDWIINVPMSQQEIANSVNLSRETVSRCMERLYRKGIVASNPDRKIIVKNLAALVNIIGEDEVIGMWPHFSEYINISV